MRRPLIPIVLVLLAPAVLLFAAEPKKQWPSAPAMQIDPNKAYTATIDTSAGKIVVDLFAKDAPKTVNSFVFLSREGFYNGTIFHRVIPKFMIQGGDPTGTGTGGPGYQFENENKNSKHGFMPGTLAMANAGPDTNGSQFFINHGESPWLKPDKYTIFGQVTAGQDVVDKIATAPTGANDRPREPVKINSVTIDEK